MAPLEDSLPFRFGFERECFFLRLIDLSPHVAWERQIRVTPSFHHVIARQLELIRRNVAQLLIPDIEQGSGGFLSSNSRKLYEPLTHNFRASWV